MTRRRGKGLVRRTATRPERVVIRLFCEGEVTERQYFAAFNGLDDVKQRVRIQIDRQNGSPTTLVHAALKSRRVDLEVDQWWCVFDVESPTPHGDLHQAIDLAEREGLQVAVSNPCFEVWLIFHHHDVGGHLETRQAEARCEQLEGYHQKAIDPEAFLPLRADAVRRALAWDQRHAGDGTSFPNNNPSSSVGKLIVVIDGT